MNNDDKWKDCRLHAFIDGQLGDDDSAELIKEMAQRPELRQHVADTRYLKGMIKQAYAGIEPPTGGSRQSTSKLFSLRAGLTGLAATLLLSIGFIVGWSTHAPSTPANIHLAKAGSSVVNSNDPLLTGGITLAPVNTDAHKVILHIDQTDTALFQDTLNEVERLLTTYDSTQTQVEVIFNSSGLNLLRTDTSPDAARLRRMMATYEHLRFVACRNTIKRLEERGIKANLIDQTQVTPSAVGHIIDRLQKGWVYIKV